MGAVAPSSICYPAHYGLVYTCGVSRQMVGHRTTAEQLTTLTNDTRMTNDARLTRRKFTHLHLGEEQQPVGLGVRFQHEQNKTYGEMRTVNL